MCNLLSGCGSNNAPTTDNDEVIKIEESAAPETEYIIVVSYPKHAYNPILRAVKWESLPSRIPWLGNGPQKAYIVAQQL